MQKYEPSPRRGFFVGAAVAGTATVALVRLKITAPVAVSEAILEAEPENGGGYTFSEHVKRYYQTARV